MKHQNDVVRTLLFALFLTLLFLPAASANHLQVSIYGKTNDRKVILEVTGDAPITSATLGNMMFRSDYPDPNNPGQTKSGLVCSQCQCYNNDVGCTECPDQTRGYIIIPLDPVNRPAGFDIRIVSHPEIQPLPFSESNTPIKRWDCNVIVTNPKVNKVIARWRLTGLLLLAGGSIVGYYLWRKRRKRNT